jgi:hypothetical protein
MKSKGIAPGDRPFPAWGALVLLAVILAILFWRSFLPGYVHFSNDGPLGQHNAAWSRMPYGLTGMWGDMNYIGGNAGTGTLSVTALLQSIMSPIMFAKFYPVVAMFLVGLGAWALFRQLRFSALATTLGAFAAMLNSTFLSAACWGVASQEIAVGMDFFALALIVSNRPGTMWLVRWTRLALAGLCVGLNVMEAADIGAIFSLLIAIFAFFHAVAEPGGSPVLKTIQGVLRVGVLAIFAIFIAVQFVLAIVGAAITGVAGTAQDSQTKAAHWDWATQWSLPKVETLGLAVPGLFGYKMDTPNEMPPALQDAYRNGVYWGAGGRDPQLVRYFDSGSQGPQPSGQGIYMRFSGGGNYCGILVLLIAGWAIAQAFRRRDSALPDTHRRMVQFWAVVMLFCILFAWGRFAPFYAILYQLPYFSTIRNPAKFVIFFGWALAIVFAYGVDGLTRLYMVPNGPKSAGLTDQVKNWWARATAFDRKWTYAILGIFGVSLLGFLIYLSEKTEMIAYLQKVGFGDTDATHDNSAPAILAFSYGQMEWFLVLLAVAIGLVLLVVAGYFNGPRAKTGALLLGALLIFDMGRANLPWIVHWDYKQKYEVGSLNPILEMLRDKPYEHRVFGLPFRPPQGLELFDDLYRVEWVQHLLPYYDIQSLDVIQMPRMPEDMQAFKEALAPSGDAATAPRIAREWQLTNTRYLLGPTGYLDEMNQELDPVQHRFRIVQRFDVRPKPGVVQPTQLAQLTAVPSENGNYALFEFTGALPRAKVYGNWQVNTNDAANLKLLGDLSFDPANTVLISTPENNLPAVATNADSGTVSYSSYESKHIVLATQAATPSVLLLNDKYDPNWRVTVDGQPAKVLRCNFIMRGVYLPTAGQHTVDFRFSLPNRPLYFSLAAVLVGLGLCGILFVATRRSSLA